MPLVRRPHVRLAPLALVAGVLFAPAHGAAPTGTPPAKPAAPPEVEIRCLDDSTLKLKLLDEKLELVTKYGTLSIPVADVRRIEFAARCPAEVSQRVAGLIGSLNHPDFAVREQATADLRALKERAYGPLLKAAKHPDPEVGRRAEEAVQYIKQRVPAGALEARECDVVHTDDMKFVGKLSATGLRVLTGPFGEQTLKLADVRSLKAAGAAGGEEVASSGAAPANLMQYQGQFGKELVFTVTGLVHVGNQTGGVWGTDVYTLDSGLGLAAVHAGQVPAGQAGTVRVRIVHPPAAFAGSHRNGVGSAAYQNFPAGAFEFVRR